MRNIFKIDSYKSEIKDEESYKQLVHDHPENILSEYADEVASESAQKFDGRVFKTVMEDTDEIIYAFYIVSSEFGDLMYRLIEVTQKNIGNEYPVNVEFNTINMENDDRTTCSNSTELREKLEDYFKSDDTGKVFGYLDRLIKIKQYERSKSA